MHNMDFLQLKCQFVLVWRVIFPSLSAPFLQHAYQEQVAPIYNSVRWGCLPNDAPHLLPFHAPRTGGCLGKCFPMTSCQIYVGKHKEKFPSVGGVFPQERVGCSPRNWLLLGIPQIFSYKGLRTEKTRTICKITLSHFHFYFPFIHFHSLMLILFTMFIVHC